MLAFFSKHAQYWLINKGKQKIIKLPDIVCILPENAKPKSQ